MGKQCIVLMLFSVAIMAHGYDALSLKNLDGKEKITQLQLYVQDMLSVPNPTTQSVASANSTSSSPTLFGLVAVLDDPVRTEPNPESEIVGRAQGLFAYSSLEEISIHMTFDIVFTGGEYNGSVLNLAGRNPYPRDYRQVSIVGGSGVFQLARGFVGIRTVSFNSSTGDAFFQYNMTILHY